MWYLIIPPIIVVVCLSFVLWYLSRKGADPLIAEKASLLGEAAREEISFLRTKNFFLRVLEKTAYRFKVTSLKIHNGLNDLTQALKVKRQRFQERVLEKRSLEQSNAASQTQTASRGDFLRRFTRQRESNVENKEQENPLAHRQEAETTLAERRPAPAFYDPVVSEPLPPVRPMVSETITRPEAVRRERTPEDAFREERLVARIAANPKDFAAYEGLGDYYLEIGNTADAKECYRQVLKLSPAQRMVKIKIHRLEKILSENV